MNRKRIIMPCTEAHQPSMLLLGLLRHTGFSISSLITGGPSLCLPLYGREFLPLRALVHATVSGRILFLCPPPRLSSTPRLSCRRGGGGDSCQAGLPLTSVGPVPTSHFTTTSPLRDYCTAIFN